MKKIKQNLNLKVPKKQILEIKTINYEDKKTKKQITSNVASFQLSIDNIPIYVKVFKVVENTKWYNFTYTLNFSKNINCIDDNGVVYEITPQEFLNSVAQYIN